MAAADVWSGHVGHYRHTATEKNIETRASAELQRHDEELHRLRAETRSLRHSRWLLWGLVTLQALVSLYLAYSL